ncbi:HYC_CC_PP family protein [Sediminicola sp. 1XM1-17]|uniref:HYC_CC_PP family protein n=1 Tax=Sediminicola sp. 1XM1-17 TaxID=3127702 RepID=UPI0030785911
MKSIFQKVFSIFMALLVLASTVSWTIGMHYCGKSLVDIALFDHADKCGMDSATNDGSGYSELRQMSCCADTLAVIIGHDDLVSSQIDISKVQQHFIAVPIAAFTLFNETVIREKSYDNYIPPKLVRDVQLLDQVFLI